MASLDRRVRRRVPAGPGGHNNEIARQLGTNVLTVKKQLGSIYGKLEFDHRGRLIALLR